MIERFRKVIDGLFRGSAPTPHDVLLLKQNHDINKIISLDQDAGNKIARTCKMLGIEHVMIPLDATKISLMKLFHHDIKKLLLDNGPTFVHCHFGKDRTGLLIAIFKIKYMGISNEDALKDAQSLGFGLNVSKNWRDLYKKLILETKSKKDSNNADIASGEQKSIVNNERENVGDNKDSYLDQANQGSFAPYINKTRQYPADSVYNSINDQSQTRENYKTNKPIKEHNLEHDVMPQVGVFNNDAGGRGFGPVENAGGFFYD
jgi:hypothetical protein